VAAKKQHIRHIFSGGFASDFGSSAEVSVNEFNQIEIPFLTKADNIVYDLDGGPRKVGGTVKINSTAVESGATVTGLYDYWKTGTAATPVQKRIIHAGTKILKEDLDGTFDDLFTGLESGKIPNYATFDDLLIIASDSNTDVPKSWDQTTAQNLAGTPPNFAFSVTHQNRQWAAGVAAEPSKLFFSALLDPEDWVGAGSGDIEIDPNNGDEITGIISYKNELWVFKGPHIGSIHRITGSAPTGDDAFARRTFARGIGAVYQNSIFEFRGDVGFLWVDGSVHTLSATASFGDYDETALTRGIKTYIEEHVNFAQLKKAWAVNDTLNSRVVISLPIDGSSTNNQILAMDYRSDPVKWATWPVFNATALAYIIDPDVSDKPSMMYGSTDGFVRKMNQPNRVIDTVTAIDMDVETPFIHYGDPYIKKTITDASVNIVPKGGYDFVYGWRTDTSNLNTKTISQAGGDALAPSTTAQFTLDTSELAGSSSIDKYVDLEEGGSFRSIQYSFRNSEPGEDLEIHAFSSIIERDTSSTEN